jgi:hypothetical protein
MIGQVTSQGALTAGYFGRYRQQQISLIPRQEAVRECPFLPVLRYFEKIILEISNRWLRLFFQNAST